MEPHFCRNDFLSIRLPHVFGVAQGDLNGISSCAIRITIDGAGLTTCSGSPFEKFQRFRLFREAASGFSSRQVPAGDAVAGFIASVAKIGG